MLKGDILKAFEVYDRLVSRKSIRKENWLFSDRLTTRRALVEEK